MKPDPNLSEQEQIALYDAEIRSNLWQIIVLIVLILAAFLKGYALHVEDAIAEAETQIAVAQELLHTCQAKAQQHPGAVQPAQECMDREAGLQVVAQQLASVKSNALNAFALAVFGKRRQ